MKVYDEKWYRNGCESPKITDENRKWYYEMYDTGISFHDCFVSKITVEQESKGNVSYKKCVLQLDCSGGFTDYDTIQFDDCCIIENADACGSWIICDELYKLDNGKIEFHILLEMTSKHKVILENFTIKCTTMTFKSNNEALSDIVIDKNWKGEKVHK